MAITKENIIEKIEVVGEYKAIQIATDTIIKENGTEISRSRHRKVIHPNISTDDLAKENSEVQSIANTVWTDAVKTAWQTKMDNK
tara:strand:- start:181 stop:435 length:255 start_codon:yes stop_codon:yes gene_type:complete